MFEPALTDNNYRSQRTLVLNPKTRDAWRTLIIAGPVTSQKNACIVNSYLTLKGGTPNTGGDFVGNTGEVTGTCFMVGANALPLDVVLRAP